MLKDKTKNDDQTRKDFNEKHKDSKTVKEEDEYCLLPISKGEPPPSYEMFYSPITKYEIKDETQQDGTKDKIQETKDMERDLLEPFLSPIKAQLTSIVDAHERKKAAKRQVTHAQVMALYRQLDDECKEIDEACQLSLKHHVEMLAQNVNPSVTKHSSWWMLMEMLWKQWFTQKKM